MIRRAVLASVLAAAALLLLAGSAAASGPQWKLTVSPAADYFVPAPDEYASYTIEAENVGGAATHESEPIVLEDTLPAGLNPEAVEFFSTTLPLGGGGGGQSPGGANLADLGLCPTLLRCEFPGPLSGVIPPHRRLIMLVKVEVPPGVGPGPITDSATVSGGGAASASASATSEIVAEPAYGLSNFFSAATQGREEPGAPEHPYTQAGGHPFQYSTEFQIASVTESVGEQNWEETGIRPVRDPQSLNAELPPGLIANPQGVPHCSLVGFFDRECPFSTVVGTLGVRVGGRHSGAFTVIEPVYNLQPTGAYPGELGYTISAIPFLINAGVRTGSDYGITGSTGGLLTAGITRVRLNLWGVPAEHSHDLLRGKKCTSGPIAPGSKAVAFWPSILANSPGEDETDCENYPGDLGGTPPFLAETPEVPFLTMPTLCAGEPLVFRGSSVSWQLPEDPVSKTSAMPPVDGCNQIGFEPSIEARPTTTLADAPSGLEFRLHLPQNDAGPEGHEDPHGVATSDLHEAVVKLPAGLAINPSSGNGLQGCSPAQIGMKTAVGQTPAHFTEVPAQCPDASKIGTASVHTALLHNPLEGSVYLATPHQNPFQSLLAAYIVLEGEGLIIKLPGQIEADPQTGQLTGKFLENPQTPFEDFHLDFFGGAKGDLRTPAVCGSYETTSVLTPYSHLEGEEEATPIAEPSAEFETTEGPQGGSCPHKASSEPNAPVFRAGTESSQAGAFTPFGFRLAREDGSQEIEKIETTLPPGLTAKLAGVAECSEAQLAVAHSREHEGGGAEEKASPACPASSEVGEVQVASGAGPTPLNVSGHAYLAGPYKGAPLSLAIITPAVAGPFDLGDVVVRTALYVAPYDAQIKAVSDPLPHILQGIPLDVRQITLRMGRPNFTVNPTNCNEMGFAGSETSVLGNVAPLAQRFQVGGCQSLPFKPKLAILLKGAVKRHTFPALTATLTMPPGQANVGSAQVTLPHNEQLEQAHITSQVCLQAQLATRTCPPASVYGYAKAETPLLDHPLEGPVYLGVGFGHKLPDLVAELNGQIRVLLHGKVDTGREDALRNTFEVVPDAPVSKFTLHMFGGKKGLIVNSENLCGKHAKRKALATFTAQSGKAVELEPTVANSCKGKAHKKGKGHRKRGGGK